ncbi:MAG TPA: VTT domain-containing protein [Bacteroidales bacterium]|nr:VTT domain-containing protein [Bacteroidales bacterium]
MLVLHLLILFCVGSFGLWLAIPVGLAYGFSPLVIAITIILGSATSTFLVYLLGNRVRRYVSDKRSDRYIGKSKAKMHRYLNKYGVIGLGLLLPGIFGPLLGMAIGITIVSATRRLLIWSLLGNVLWSVFLTGISALGITIL